MEIERDQVCILIPTLNEAPTIAGLIHAFHSLGYPHVMVMDGNSTDGTQDLAREAGAAVHVQTGKGKGNAVIEAADLIDLPYALMLDGDGTYRPEDAEKMLEPLFTGYDHVIGDRLAYPDSGAFTGLNLFGNKVINFFFKIAHGHDLHDILSGYRAFTLPSLREMNLQEAGFEIETEMAVQSVKCDHRVAVVPVRYLPRPGTPTKLNPLQDGFRITSAIYRLAKVNNPLFYFGLIGIGISTVGGVLALYVLFEWLNGIEHLPLTVLTVLLIVVGFEIFMFGVISDMLLSFHREVMREIQRLQPPKKPE
ncbi:S-layer glycoprotein N-glycosyltransferase AglJ [Methanofollis formosanus]|uniref:S-layer glycoprotein N-glycosyltransferase AglJ n=1 Tax=Methanofollis formosanus TaxID=299308 RepID=A0A8G1A0M1_9EURY|nr:S-layer glycoprotein N-glycosyltransferase AglJ [Methanofollis formosanus]QYZ78258.1 S-layer glycoprotein N-glycosyltransferase AglJ [Methanofollis formosanus]